jgi:carbon-monoxide dehydrogenase small subunit
MKIAATLRVNGTDYPVELDPHVSLLKAVREELGLTGSKEGCDDSECGACMMLLDGEPVNACSYLALQAEGREVTTVEGLAGRRGGRTAPAGVPASRRACNAGSAPRGCWCPRRRCFVTTPIPPRGDPDRPVGNLCRCTGYRGIVRAVRQVASGNVPPLESAPVHPDTTPPHHAG